MPRAARMEDLPRPFGRYELRALLGQGGMGEVYLAHDPQLDRVVALKTPRPIGDDPVVWRGRFLAEARAAATLNHPNICPVFDVGEVDAQPFLTMAYVDGETLASRARRTGPTPIPEALALVGTVARAMAEAHERGIVHRDLKPANVMIDRRGQPVVMDFGLALRSTASDNLRLTLSGVAMGTPSYMPPEQAGGDHEAIGPPADVYALGVTLYELVTGRVPFQARSFGKLLAQIERDPPSRPSDLNAAIDAALDALILKALAKAPEDRFATAGALADALDRYLEGERDAAEWAVEPTAPYIPADDVGRRSGKLARPGARRRCRPAVAAGVIGIGLLVALGVLIYVKTDYGDLVIELSDSSAKVGVKVNGQEVTLDPEGHPIRIRAGENQMLEVSGPGFETASKRFDLKRSGKAVVSVHLKSAASPLMVSTRPSAPPAKPVAYPERPTLVKLTGWQILTDATKEEMQKWLDDRKAAKHFVTWLDAVSVGDKPLFSAVGSLDGRERVWEAFLDLTLDEINNVNLLEKRFRRMRDSQLMSISGYAEHKEIKAVALFQRSQGETTFGSVGILPIRDARGLLANMEQRDLVTRLIRLFPIDSERVGCALYAESDLAAKKRHAFDLNQADLTSRLETYRRDGYVPVSVVSYQDQSVRRFAVTYRENPSKVEWDVSRDLASADMAAKATERAKEGYAPASITACPWDGAVRYTVVWVRAKEKKHP